MDATQALNVLSKLANDTLLNATDRNTANQAIAIISNLVGGADDTTQEAPKKPVSK
jgi:hypothetical protein